MRVFLLTVFVAVAFSQDKKVSLQEKKVSPVEVASKNWLDAEASVQRLMKETEQLAVEWQNRQVQIRDAKLRQKESELILQANLCEKGQQVKMSGGKPVCETPPKEKKE